MTREADVVKSLVEMADTLAGDYDVVDMLTGLADRCVHLLGVSAAGVMLASPAGSLGLVAPSSEAMRLNEQLSGALTSRVVIEQAKGAISERAGIDLAGAFSRLRAYARNHNLRLTDVAQAAIEGTLDPLAWAPPPRPASP